MRVFEILKYERASRIVSADKCEIYFPQVQSCHNEEEKGVKGSY